MLNIMETFISKMVKEKNLIMFDEWDLLKMSENELLAFQETTKIFLKSKIIRLSNVISIFELFSNELTTLIDALDNPYQGAMGTSRSIEQLMVLKSVYIMMKAKLLNMSHR